MDCSLNEKKKRNQNEYMLISINFILFNLGSGPGEFFQPVVFTLKKGGKYGGVSDYAINYPSWLHLREMCGICSTWA